MLIHERKLLDWENSHANIKHLELFAEYNLVVINLAQYKWAYLYMQKFQFD